MTVDLLLSNSSSTLFGGTDLGWKLVVRAGMATPLTDLKSCVKPLAQLLETTLPGTEMDTGSC